MHIPAHAIVLLSDPPSLPNSWSYPPARDWCMDDDQYSDIGSSFSAHPLSEHTASVSTNFNFKDQTMYMHLHLQSPHNLVLSVNSQTQAALASLNISVQNIGAEVIALKEQIAKRPLLKKKKVQVTVNCVYNYCKYLWYFEPPLCSQMRKMRPTQKPCL